MFSPRLRSWHIEIATELAKAFGGKPTYRWSDDDGSRKFGFHFNADGFIFFTCNCGTFPRISESTSGYG
jgi:hypothetical protein